MFTKPWGADELQQWVAAALEQHRILTENRRLRALADEQAVRPEHWNQRLEGLVSDRTSALERVNVSLQRGLMEVVGLLVTSLEAAVARHAPQSHLNEHGPYFSHGADLQATAGDHGMNACAAPTMFLSYSYDSEAHSHHVLQLALRLRSDGVDCRIDQLETDYDTTLPVWMQRQVLAADFVGTVFTETYARRALGQEALSRGLGASWEAAIIMQLLYERRLDGHRILPILFDHADVQHIPPPVSGLRHFLVDSESGYEDLLRHVHGRPRVAPTPIGPAPNLPPREVEPLRWPGSPRLSGSEPQAIQDRRQAFLELRGRSFDTPQYQNRLLLRTYLAPARAVFRIRFGDQGRDLLREARRQYFPEMREAAASPEEMRFEELSGRDRERIALLIVGRDAQCHYIQAIPARWGAAPEERIVALSTILAVLRDSLTFARAALPQLFDYSGMWFCGVLLDHLHPPTRVQFDVYAPAPDPRHRPGFEVPLYLPIERESVDLTQGAVMGAADLAKEVLDGLGYDGGDAYVDAWVADGARR